MATERLQKLMAHRGLASRREAEGWIRAGRVRVNGQVVTELGTRADPEVDRVEVDGVPLPAEDRRLTLLLNKPAGYVTTVRDPHAEKTVMDLLADCPTRVYPVGRLDVDTRGVLLLTNDGALAHQLTHPSRGVEKVYAVIARGTLDDAALAQLARGVELEDGLTAPARVAGVQRRAGRTLFRLTLHEGRNRQVRRMVQALGARVENLSRISFGGLAADGLAEGEYRALEEHELRRLCAAGAGKRPGGRQRTRTRKG